MLFIMISHKSYSQYTLRELAKKTIVKTKTPTILPNTKKQGDTIFTTYTGGSTEILQYFVEGEKYDEIFNPNPSGLYLNKQHFTFYCDPDKTSKQSITNIANIYEFTFLGRNYLFTITLRENTDSKYKCYNFFDITDTNKITQGSFPSIYVGEDSFGDFNGDNSLDFITIINRKPETFKQKIQGITHMLRAYTLEPNGVKILQNDSTKFPYFIYALFENDKMSKFKVLQADWFFPLQDSTGRVLEKVSYFSERTNIYEPRPVFIDSAQTIEAKKYSVEVGRFDLEEGVHFLRKELINKQTIIKPEEIFITIDQHGSDIKWVLWVGNYATKTEARKTLEALQKLGYQTEIVDLRRRY